MHFIIINNNNYNNNYDEKLCSHLFIIMLQLTIQDRCTFHHWAITTQTYLAKCKYSDNTASFQQITGSLFKVDHQLWKKITSDTLASVHSLNAIILKLFSQF